MFWRYSNITPIRRFFQAGYEGSSGARLQESDIREDILRKLHRLESNISAAIRKIKNELNETVTYEGIVYSEKMKTDYLDMIRKLELLRKTNENKKEGNGKKSRSNVSTATATRK